MIYCILSYWGLRDKPYNIISVINSTLISILGVTILRLSRKNTLADSYMKTNCSRPCRSYKRSYNTVRVEAVNGLSVSFSSQWYGYICEFTGITGTVKKKKVSDTASRQVRPARYTHTHCRYIYYIVRVEGVPSSVFIVLIKSRTKLDVVRPVRKRPVYTWASIETQRRYTRVRIPVCIYRYRTAAKDVVHIIRDHHTVTGFSVRSTYIYRPNKRRRHNSGFASRIQCRWGKNQKETYTRAYGGVCVCVRATGDLGPSRRRQPPLPNRQLDRFGGRDCSRRRRSAQPLWTLGCWSLLQRSVA